MKRKARIAENPEPYKWRYYPQMGVERVAPDYALIRTVDLLDTAAVGAWAARNIPTIAERLSFQSAVIDCLAAAAARSKSQLSKL